MLSETMDLPDTSVKPIHFEVVRLAETSRTVDLGEAVIRAFQGAYDHYENEQLAWDFAHDDNARYVPTGPNPRETKKAVQRRHRSAANLYGKFVELETEISDVIRTVVEWDIRNPVDVKPLYNVPVIFTALGCSVPARRQSLGSYTYGRPIINQAGYLMPIVGLPDRQPSSERRYRPPTWWIRLLDNATGEPIVKLEFPEFAGSFHR